MVGNLIEIFCFDLFLVVISEDQAVA